MRAFSITSSFHRVALCVAILAPLVAAGSARAAIDIFVSPTGSDSNRGSKDSPLASLDAARDLARKQSSGGAATIWISGGEYRLSSPVELGRVDDSLLLRAVENERPVFTNSRRLSASDFHLVADAATLDRISPAARGSIVALDLRALGVVHAKKFDDMFTDSGDLLDLFVNGQRMTLSRAPADSDLMISRVLFNAGGPTTSSASNQSPQWTAPASGARGGIFEYRPEAQPLFESWAKEVPSGLWLKGFWRVMWENETIRVASIDLQKHTVAFAKPVPGGIGNKYHRPAGNGKEQYWAVNLLEGIVRPGQWCIDFQQQKLFFFPPANFDKAEIELADDDRPVFSLNQASHVSLIGLTVRDAMGDAIKIAGGSDDLIAGCMVRDVDRYAVVVDGGTHHTVQSCDLYHLGCGGVWLSGGDDRVSPRIPAGHRVINNHIHHFSELVQVYTPAVNCGYVGGNGKGHHPAVGMYVAHNLIHDTPHGGILTGDWDSVFEYNEIFRYCLVSNDLGAFYCYDTYALDGNQTFRYNFVHGSFQGDGFYFDQDHRDMHLYGNIAALQSDLLTRGTGFLFKIGTQAKNPTSIDCYNNIAFSSKVGFNFVSALPDQGRIENNVVIGCKQAFNWFTVKNDKAVKSPPYGTGDNKAYDADPGFVDLKHLDFHLKPDAQLKKDLPNFKPIPVDQIGLQIDEYRKTLPTDAEIHRFEIRVTTRPTGYDTEDR
jgi:hypothetical protein